MIYLENSKIRVYVIPGIRNLNMNRYFLLLFFITMSFSCHSDDDTIKGNADAFILLCNSDILFITDKNQKNAFFNLLSSENANNIFFNLFSETKTKVGKFYALLGLFESDRKLYNELVSTINLTDKITAQTMRSADFIFSFTFNQLITAIETGRWMKNLTHEL